MTRAMYVLSVGLSVMLAGCDSVIEPRVEVDGFSVVAADGQLTLRNASESTIHYVAVEEEESALVDLHYDPQSWPALAPGAELRVAYGEVIGYDPGDRQVRIYWWTAGESREYLRLGLR